MTGLLIAAWCLGVVALMLILADEHGRELGVTADTLTGYGRMEGHHPTAHLTETGWMTACTCTHVLDGCIRAERRPSREQAVARAADQLADAGHGLGW